MAQGRPSEYSEATLKAAEKYLTSYEKEGDAVPMIEGLALAIGVSRETVYAWARDPDKTAFSDIVNRLRAMRSRGLQNGGLKNVFNPRISGLLLGHEGYRERSEIEITDPFDAEAKEKARKARAAVLGGRDTGAGE